MIKIDIFSGFLGAGKTTLIQKLLKEAYTEEKVVLIENEFGEIGVDGGFFRESGVEIKEMNSGCICCSLVGDFSKALGEVAKKFSPDRILIEPSGVGKLSDVIRAVQKADVEGAVLNVFCTVVDAKKCKMYLKNFGEFFLDQVENAGCVILSHTLDPQKTQEALALLKEHTKATVVTTDWDKLSGKDMLRAMERKDTLEEELKKLASEDVHEHHHHHDDDDDDDHECCHHHHHDDDDDDDHECCHHHHHDDDDDEHECCHHHHHDDDDDHECCHHDGEHHHHHADEVFSSWGRETAKVFSEEKLTKILSSFEVGEYGQILRAKGIVDGGEHWLYFDYVPGEIDIRKGAAAATGRLCVIGCKLDEHKLEELFFD